MTIWVLKHPWGPTQWPLGLCSPGHGRLKAPKLQLFSRLRRWAVGGMSIDYVKCFDLIPRAVVLALALELGMDPGTCRALGAPRTPCCLSTRARGTRRWVAGVC